MRAARERAQTFYMPATALQPPYGFIHRNLGRARVIPFLGAGASLGARGAGNPMSASELATRLAEDIGFPRDDGPPELTKVAQYYLVMVGRRGLYDTLHEIFGREYETTAIHRYLASIEAPLLIVTTNYDDLVERALTDAGRPFDVVIHTTDPDLGDLLLWRPHGGETVEPVNPNRLDIDPEAVTVVYKMHGTVDRMDPSRDQYVITEDDYVDFLVRMTKKKAIPAVFAEPFQTRNFLFLGYSMEDWNLRVVLSRIHKEMRRADDITSWAVQLSPSSLESEFWGRRNVQIFDVALDDFVSHLASA